MTMGKISFEQLSQKIVINLARQFELQQQVSLLNSKAGENERLLAQLTREIKLLTEENTDLKEIVYELHQENQRLRQQTHE